MCPSPVIVTPLCKAPWEQISFQEPRIVGLWRLWRQFYTILWNMHSNKVAKRDWKGFQCLTVRLETFLWLFKTFRNFLELLRPFWTSWDFLGFLRLFELKTLNTRNNFQTFRTVCETLTVKNIWMLTFKIHFMSTSTSSIIFVWMLNIKLVKTSETVSALSHCF